MIVLLCIMMCAVAVQSFIPYPFGAPFRIKDREVRQTIHRPELSNINGFFGMIGPDVNATSVSSLYELFTGDGVINGVFFDNGTLTYVNHFIRTEKLLYEETNGRMPTDLMHSLWFMVIRALRLFPNCMDVANTALLRTRNHIYAMFERDIPYRIAIDTEDKTIDTVCKDPLYPGGRHVSAHSKYDAESDTMETLDYEVMTQTVYYRRFRLGTDPTDPVEFHMKYLPITHDFISTPECIVVIDSPIQIQTTPGELHGIPIQFRADLPTYIYVLDKRRQKIHTYTYPTGFYIFHFASFRETSDRIEIIAPMYTDLNMNSLDLRGTYSKLVLYKHGGKVMMYSTNELKKYNLEFPVAISAYNPRYGIDLVVDEPLIILRHFHDRKARCFVLCKGLRIVRRIWLKNLSVCGEPAVIDPETNPTLVCFTNDDSRSYLSLFSLTNSSQIHVPIQNDIRVGFHSIYVSRNIIPTPIKP
jgi:hypothetical protein